MYTPEEDKVENITNPYWDIYIKEVVGVVNHINNSMSRSIEGRRLNCEFSGSKEYPNLTIYIQSTEMLIPVYKVNNPYGKTPLTKRSYTSTEDLITQIIDTYNDRTKFELKGN